MNLTTYLLELKKSWLERKIPNISENNAEFLKELIRGRKPKNLLEIGTANGYSTLQFASAFLEWALPDWHITTLEYAENAYTEAQFHFEKTVMTEYITSLFGDAKSILPTLPGDYFDFVFIDAMKREYLDYLLLSLPKMTRDALIVIDDVEKFRPKMENLYAFLDEKNIPYRLEKTDPDDSIMIIERSSILY